MNDKLNVIHSEKKEKIISVLTVFIFIFIFFLSIFRFVSPESWNFKSFINSFSTQEETLVHEENIKQKNGETVTVKVYKTETYFLNFKEGRNEEKY